MLLNELSIEVSYSRCSRLKSDIMSIQPLRMPSHLTPLAVSCSRSTLQRVKELTVSSRYIITHSSHSFCTTELNVMWYQC
jgi:hypothetical protein